MTKVVVASGNAGKLCELRRLLEPLGLELFSQAELGITSVPETGDTFEANALIKARHAADASGFAAIADDSGIVVDALDGAPGVYSARYAGELASDEDNIEKLLSTLDSVGDSARGAHFECVIVYVQTETDAAPIMATGRWYGEILREPCGAQGFGYDPVFKPEGLHVSAAELAPETKNRLSHRARAIRDLLEQIG